jgi:hypothetical protein
LNFNGLHGVVSQKIVLFVTTTARTSNPTQRWEFPVPRQPSCSPLLKSLFAMRAAQAVHVRTVEQRVCMFQHTRPLHQEGLSCVATRCSHSTPCQLRGRGDRACPWKTLK